MLTKDDIYEAYKRLKKIEKLLDKAMDMWDFLPDAVQDAIAGAHGDEHHNLHHCLRWGLLAAQETDIDWAKIVADVEVEEAT